MLTKEEINRYSRHILLPGIGEAGQEKLKASKVMVIGAGGLGCPVLLYLAAAGVGTIGIVDFDRVDESNLQRQVLFSTNDTGKLKTVAAAEKLKLLNPFITLNTYPEKLTVSNALDLFSKYDIIIDGTDNFSTRYLVNDACVITDKPLVYGSIHRFEGQVSVFNAEGENGKRGPTYRCLFPTPPPAGSIPSCSEAGVLGVLPGMIGTMQANEAIKLITGTGETLSGKILTLDSLTMQTTTLNISRNENEWKRQAPAGEKQFREFNYDHFCGVAPTLSSGKEITAAKLRELLRNDKGISLLDVREMGELPQAEGLNAVNIPLGNIESLNGKLDPEKKTVVFCRSGARSAKAIKILEEKYGYKNLVNLKGGILAWLKN